MTQSTTERPDAILVRHFATPLNEKGISRGHLPIGIDKELAKKLAPEVARVLDQYGITRLISSDLPRAEQSTKLIASLMAAKPELEHTEELETWNPGDRVAGKPEKETIPIRQKYIKYHDEKPPDGEAFDAFIDRFRAERKNIMKPGTAFVAHGHHVLAAPAVFMDEEIDPKKLATLDEEYPPAGVYGFYLNRNDVRIERLDNGKENSDG